MNIIKKLIITVIVCLMCVIGFLPSNSYAATGSLNDAQRKALVDTVVRIIDEGNKARILRYSQGHRMVGYNWQKVTQSTKQLTSGYTNLTEIDLARVTEALNRSLGIEDYDDWKICKVKAYRCFYEGDDINDTIPFDCSSLVSAAYNMAVGTPYGSWAWNSTKYSESSDWFSVSSDMSSLKPGDILWKQGHVALYLGDCYGNGKKYIAEAFGFARISKEDSVLRQQLVNFLCSNVTYIKEHPDYNGQQPKLQLPASGVMDVTKQVIIQEYKAGRFNKVATYIGPISAGRAIDTTDLKTGNLGDGSGVGELNLSSGGLDHDPIVLPGNYTVVWPEGLVLEDQTLATSDGYFYKGTPTYGQYVGRIDLFNWLIEGTQNVLDWFIGFVTYGFKAALIGWTAIMEDVMSEILNFGLTPMTSGATALNDEITALNKVHTIALAYNLVSEEAGEMAEDVLTELPPSASSSSSNTSNQVAETKKKITIEDVLFNRVPVLDINFFDFENAGGEKLVEGSLIYKIRQTLASWYYVIRMTVIMGMLVVLLYLAIKIAISVPGKKAEYKSKLVDWLVGFIIVFAIHYFMVAVVNFNNQIVKILDPVITAGTTVDTPQVESGSNTNVVTQNDGQTSLYEAIRIQSYDIRATTGITATILYMALVFFMIRFVILYAKRMFILAVLTVISPIMGLLYSLNKKKYKIGDWGKEYIFNVLIQFVHVVIYTSIVAIAFDLTKTSTFRGGVIALMTLAFLFVAEGMVKKIFGFNKASSAGSLADSAAGQLAAVGLMKTIYDKTEQKTNKAAAGQSKSVNWVNNKYDKWIHNNMSVSDWQNQYKAPEGVTETDEELRNRRAKTVLDSKGFRPNTKHLNTLIGPERDYIVDKNGVPMVMDELDIDPNKKDFFNMSQINNVIRDTKQEEIDARRAYATQGLKDAFNATTGTFSLMASIPMLVVSPKYGLGLAAYGIHGMSAGMGRRKIKGAKPMTEEQKRWTGKRLVFAWATGGFSEGVTNMYRNSEDARYVLETTYNKRLDILNEAREIEDQIARDMVAMELDRKASNNSYTINGEETAKVKEAKEKMEQVALSIDKQEFEKALNLTLQEVKKKDIEKVVEKYILGKQTEELTSRDIENITRNLGRTVEEKYKDISLSNEFAEVIREEIRDRVLSASEYVVAGVDKKDLKKSAQDANIATANDIREKYSRNNESNTHLGGSNVNKPTDNINKGDQHTTIDTNTDATKDKLEKTKVHLKEEDNNPIETRITKKELEEKVDNIIKNMKQDELVDVISSALKRKEAIDREIKNPRYVELMEKVKRLKELDKKYDDLTGESIYREYTVKDKKIQPKRDKEGEIEYQSVSDVVKQMRNYLVEYINGKA